MRDRRDDVQRGSPYDAKFNVAEIGAVNFNFNLLQRALVLEDYGPVLGVEGFASRKRGARSRGEGKKEGGNHNNNK